MDIVFNDFSGFGQGHLGLQCHICIRSLRNTKSNFGNGAIYQWGLLGPQFP